MRNAIKEYIEYSSEEKNDLWNTATFVFDTNVFLNLYRYSNKTRNQLIESFECLKPRIWMPYQVALEFCKDRYDVIDEVNRRFESIKVEVDNLVDSWRKKLRLDENDQDIEELLKYLKDWVIKKKESNYFVFDMSNDEVFNKLLELFNGKTGKAFNIEERQNIEQEGEKRYEAKMPPGYMDNKKTENKYGDLLVWKEILDYATTQSVDIIFVTHDQKEDWWNTNHGKKIGPRIELRKEFYEKTGQRFHMYTMPSFLSFFTKNKENSIDKETIDEVDLFASIIENKDSPIELTEYYEFFKGEKEKEVTRLRFEIANIERKNELRIKQINKLQKRARREQLSLQEKIALQGNKENMKKDNEKLVQLKEQLSYLISFNSQVSIRNRG